MFEIWDYGGLGCLRCGIFRAWDVGDVGFLGY